MSAPLESLPEETLDRIISFVGSPLDLASLLRVSKRFNRIALPHLYADVWFNGTGGTGGDIWAHEWTSKQLRLFTFFMLQKPELAALVKHFTLRENYGAEENRRLEDAEETWPEHSDMNEILRNAIQKHIQDGERQRKWFKAVKALNRDQERAFLALLLPALVNLRSMDVPGHELGPKFDEYILQTLDRAAVGRVLWNGLPMFGNLTDICISGIIHNDVTGYPNNPAWFATCLGLPAIKRIYGYNQGDEGEDEDEDAGQEPTRLFSKLQPCSSPVEYIELRKSKLSIPYLKHLLRAAKHLRVMIYDIANSLAWTALKFSAIQSALELQKDNLERLSLGHDPHYSFMESDEMVPMSFSAFTSLKHLRFAPIFMYGQGVLPPTSPSGTRHVSLPPREELEVTKMRLVDALPSQLETLGFINCMDGSSLDRIAVSIRELLAQNERFESLHEVTIYGRWGMVEKLDVLKTLPWKNVRLLVKLQQLDWDFGENGPWGWDREVRWGDRINDYDMGMEVVYDSEAYWLK